MVEMNLIAGLDIGNGYVKGRAGAFGVKPTDIDLPSCTTVLSTTNDLKVTEERVDHVLANIFNQMEVSFGSHMVEQTRHHLLGERAVMQSGSDYIDQFEVTSAHQSKARQDLSAVLTLSCLAGKALQDYYAQHKTLPGKDDIIQLRVRVALALPINEYMDYRAEYANNYRKGSHMVTIHNFENPVRVQVIFDDVQVLAEGAAAHYALRVGGEQMMAGLLNDLRSMESVIPGIQKRLEGITPKLLTELTSVCGIDIGEGTVNFPVMEAGYLNPNASTSMNKGYGLVLEAACNRLQREGHSITNRKQLSEYLKKTPTALNKNQYAKIQQVVSEELGGLAADIQMRFRKLVGSYGIGLELVFVYGGGATSMRNVLYPMLLRTLQDFGGMDVSIPVLYLETRYSRYLNRNGLYYIADQLAQRLAKQNSAGSTKA